MKTKKLIILLLVLFFLIPLGLLTDSPSWGEWDLSYYEQILGFIPEKMKTNTIIPALLPDYNLENFSPIISYYASAILGTALIFASFYGLYKLKR